MEVEVAILLEFWCTILERVNKTSKSLQNPSIDIVDSIKLLNSLISFLDKLRNIKSFKDIEEKGKTLLRNNFELNEEAIDYNSAGKRTQKRTTRYDDGNAPDTIMEGSNKLRIVTYYPVLDSILMELGGRVEVMDSRLKPFNFLLNLEKLSNEDIQKEASKLQQIYVKDLDKGLLVLLLVFTYFLNSFSSRLRSRMFAVSFFYGRYQRIPT